MTSEKSDFRLVVLGDENYITWKWHMLMVLKTKGLIEYIEKEEFKDAAKECQAATLIASALNTDNMHKVINCTTAYSIWKTLEANFENKSSTERTMLLEKFTSYRIRSTNDISKALGDIQARAARLKTLGASVDDELIISVILKALPDSMRAWKNTWKMINAEKPKLNNLITGIMAEVNEMSHPEGAALLTKKFENFKLNTSGTKDQKRPKWNNSRNSKGSNRNYEPTKAGKKDTCSYCKKKGHWSKDCYKKKADEGNAKRTGPPSKDQDKPVVFMANTSDDFLKPTQWLADSGCSQHMTPHLGWISNYNSFDQEKDIILGDGRAIKAVGSGTISTNIGDIRRILCSRAFN